MSLAFYRQNHPDLSATEAHFDPVFEGFSASPAAERRQAEAHRTLRAFLTTLYPERRVRAAAGTPGAWVNEYPPHTEDTDVRGGFVPIKGMDLDRPVAVHLALKQWRRKGRPHRYRFAAFDLDSKVLGAGQVVADASLLMPVIRAEGIPVVPVESGSPGGVHLWTGCAQTVAPELIYRINRAAVALCPSLDPSPLGNASQGLVRAPGAAHRNGGYSRLIEHTPDEAVRLLGPESAPAAAFIRLAVRLEAMVAALPASAVEGSAVIEVVPAVDHGATAPAPAIEPGRPSATRQERGHGGHFVPPSITARGPRLRRIVTDKAGCPRVDTPKRALGAKAVAGLRRRPGRREDHSALKHSPARSMALAGWTEAEGLHLACDAESSPALEWVRSERMPDGSRRPRSRDEVRRLWARVWWLAVEDAARLPHRPQDDGRDDAAQDDVRGAVADLLARMDTAGPDRWARQSGPADAAVLHAVAWLMILAGTTDVAVNVRRVGVLAGYTAQTASVALRRLVLDGWLAFTAEPERRSGKARRATLATDHKCTGHEYHRCAVPMAPLDVVSAGHAGSDRSGTPRPPAPPYEFLRVALTHQQAGLWHDLGHHAARTLRAVQTLNRPDGAVQTLNRPDVTDLMSSTGYGRRTTLRHLRRLHGLKLVSAVQLSPVSPTRDSNEEEPIRTGPGYETLNRGLYEAAKVTGGSADRIAHHAVTARIEQARHEWLIADEHHWATPREQRPKRVPADQAVIPGMDPLGRAYPRHENNRYDHDRARAIEAERIGALGMLDHARHLAERGELIDPPYLSATGAQPAPRRRRRAVLPARQHCRRCQAAPGQRCVTGRGQVTAQWHAARRTAAVQAAQDTAESQTL